MTDNLPVVIPEEVLYRYEESILSSEDECSDFLPAMEFVSCTKFKVLKWTPKGAWIAVDPWEVLPWNRIYDYDKCPKKKFVLLTAMKQFASRTREKALDCFLHRKYAQ